MNCCAAASRPAPSPSTPHPPTSPPPAPSVSGLGLDSRVHYVHGDFTAAADTISPADAVILDRVICCYPNLNDLLGASAAKAERFLALSYPREKWWVRLAFNLYNLSLRLKRINFRTYLHRHSGRPFHRHQKRP